MAKVNYTFCLGVILQNEGGYTVDNGGPTNMGITLPTLSAFYGRAATVEELQGLRRMVDVPLIYKDLYWDKVRGDDLPYAVDLVTFDAAVNSGAEQAVKWLQRAVGASVDGIMGARTMGLVQRANPYELTLAVCEQRMGMLLGLNNKTEETYERGWNNRVLKVLQLATCMLAESGKVFNDLTKGGGA